MFIFINLGAMLNIASVKLLKLVKYTSCFELVVN